MPDRKIAYDPGHGMGNSDRDKPKLYDPGAQGNRHDEADIALSLALACETDAINRGWGTFLTRRDKTTTTYVGDRHKRAMAAGCNFFVSIHLNSADSSQATGTETLYNDDSTFANLMQKRLVVATMLRDRGAKRRDDLAVLRNSAGNSVLIEVGFISNPSDLKNILGGANHLRIAQAINDGIDDFFKLQKAKAKAS
jgi:N-acetylmuramoyl-L-alanine amidase